MKRAEHGESKQKSNPMKSHMSHCTVAIVITLTMTILLGCDAGRLHHIACDAGVYVDVKTAQFGLTETSESAATTEIAVRILDFQFPNQDQESVAHPTPSWPL